MEKRRSEGVSAVSVRDKKIFRLGELFCGPGGLALGARNAKAEKNGALYAIEHEWATDYDKDSCETYARNISPGRPETVVCQNIRSLNLESLPPIDAFAYGFPCNDFSIVGEKKGFNGAFGPLYEYGVKVLNRFRPEFFVAENVGGITSANDGIAFEKILDDLENSGNGYRLTAHLYKFEEYGIPQTRHRIIIVGMDKKTGLVFRVPKPATPHKPVTVREALENPPIPPSTPNQELTSQSQKVIERLKSIRPGENAWNADLPDHLKLNVKGAKLSQIYKRLDPDKPAYTITGSGGGGTHGYHWSEPRALTNRERARIQTFPDNFVFHGSKESVRKQMGMAVPPKMSEIIFTAVLKTFAGIEYPSVSPSWKPQLSLF
ncbi:DNA cytosine methyltransferase [Candidatus Uhrbacteria bacterium]|nr:DNA cytosine methyltransferase [Candidatus Uhrbacteria bacterium]